MNNVPVLMVRIYITESSGLLPKILNYLKKEAKVRGVSVFRAIRGYGETGNHTTSLVDLSLDLPLTIEFFDHQEKVAVALEALNKMVKPEHIVTWEAKSNQ
ncbi:DUF190 domain-containing protein [Candidatus Berkiella aquae]|uniref:DUF190 domain-containing protein n=1 Tax=Candidatus Berkiella aquae TaxID=295108 RepID=A0A0Q9Z0B6_9GAMM|nr:DUF190 domain-containing protein [Candidatus Berkiella aquae]MCS5711936.1 DUF190 domain-containing protein [Candidatus Berkiella aquae]